MTITQATPTGNPDSWGTPRPDWANPKYRSRKASAAQPTKPEYDGRFSTGKVLVVLGLIIAALAIVVPIATADQDSGNEIDFSGAAVFGGGGSFLILLGVILIAGAQRIDR